MVRWYWVAAAFFLPLSPFAPAVAGDMETCENQNDNSPQAVAACTRIISGEKAKGNKLADIYYERGSKHRSNGNLDQAIADFSSAIRINPRWSFPYVARGHTFADKRQFERAFADQEAAIRLEPTAVSYVGRAMDLMAAGALDRAISDLDEALRLDPKYFYAFLRRGDVHLKKRDFDKALSDYRMALQIGTPNTLSMEQAREGMTRATNRIAE